MKLARLHKVDLIGGDTTRGPLNICVQIMGTLPRGDALRRDGARVGEDIWVSGTLGDAAIALAEMRKRIVLQPAEFKHCVARLHTPTPRIALGIALRSCASSAIDISDGLVADLGHICERSHIAAEIDYAALPLSPALRRRADEPLVRDAALSGGDDYELCFTASPSARKKLMSIASRLKIKLRCIGRTVRVGKNTAAPAVTVFDMNGAPLRLKRTGYDHFI